MVLLGKMIVLVEFFSAPLRLCVKISRVLVDSKFKTNQ